jgi:hypothetical protein
MSAKLNSDFVVKIMFKSKLKPLEDYRSLNSPWKCECLKCKRVVSPSLKNVRDRHYGCKFCAGKAIDPSDAIKVLKDKNLKPLEVYPGASKKWKSQCLLCKSIVSPRLSDLKIGHSGCVKCSNVVGVKKKVEEYIKKYKVIQVMKSSKLEPLEPFQRATKPWKCKCLKCNSVIKVKFTRVKTDGNTCATCYKLNHPRTNALDHKTALKVMKSKNLKPLVTYPGAMKPWKSKCLDCGNVISPRYAHIQQGRKGCKFCGIEKNRNSSRTSQDVVYEVARKAGFEPQEPYKSRHVPWKLKCLKCGKIVTPHYGRIADGGGCGWCNKVFVDPKEAKQKMLKGKLKPLEKYPGAGKPWKCKCLKCGKTVFTRYSQLASGIGGCKYCANRGYDFSSPGILYLITNAKLEAHKIGITNLNSKEKRLKDHFQNGWIEFRSKLFQDGNDAYVIEQEILTWFRSELQLPNALGPKDMPQRGWTETVSSVEIDLASIWTKVELIAKSHNTN